MKRWTGVMLALALALAGSPGARAAEAPSGEVLDLALMGYARLVEAGEVLPGALLTVIDYSLPSTVPRLFVYDPASESVLHASLVAHGKNSGANWARKFGNRKGSLRSSLGFYVTLATYYGRHGYSLRLRGLEPGFNDNAFDRAIVIHGADYVSEEFVEDHGRLGRSWGCPAVPRGVAAELIDLIKEGSCVYIHGEDHDYITNSELLGE